MRSKRQYGMALQLRRKKQTDEIIPLLKASSYRVEALPYTTPTDLTRATKPFSSQKSG